MSRFILCSMLALGLVASTAEAKKKKEQSEVQKALSERYPDAKTEIASTSEINGVKVYDVKISTKERASTAQITDYCDFLMYGKPHGFSAIEKSIAQDVSGLFTAKPEDVEMYRVTNYYVDFKGPKNKNYTARFDAVGRLKDVMSS